MSQYIVSDNVVTKDMQWVLLVLIGGMLISCINYGSFMHMQRQ